jgi:hypothetical protein
VLLTVGEDEKRNVFIPAEDLLETDPRTGELKGFAGEARVMRELRFLAENEQRPVIYFTQSNGEMSIGGAGADTFTVTQSASQLKTFLEKAYLDVRPLTFTGPSPSIPADAAIVVVAEPQTTLSDVAAGAIRKYMTEPRPDGRKGKLIVLAGAVTGPDNKGVVRTGLEGLLAEMNVQLGNKYIYSMPLQQAPDFRVAAAVFAKASEQNPITQAIGAQVRALPFLLPREVATLTNPGQYQATSLLITLPNRETWLEDERMVDPERTITDLLEKPAVAAQKGFTETPRSVAAVVSEGGTARAVVYGNAYIFSDRYAEQRGRGATSSPVTFDLMAVTIDWLRDRPPLPTGIESKKYTEYQFPDPAGVDTTRLVWLPLGFSLLLVLGLGTGVWVIRRK